jgi:hypothetical protein
MLISPRAVRQVVKPSRRQVSFYILLCRMLPHGRFFSASFFYFSAFVRLCLRLFDLSDESSAGSVINPTDVGSQWDRGIGVKTQNALFGGTGRFVRKGEKEERLYESTSSF